MQDPRALKNPTNLRSWRAWQSEGFRRSGYVVIFGGVFPPLVVAFVLAVTLLKPRLVVAEAGFGLYLAVCFGLMALAMLRLNAWQRANPWTPPT